jgi:chromate transport protein ChrA
MTLAEFVGYVAVYNVLTMSNGPVMAGMLEQTLVTHHHSLAIEQLLFAFTLGRITPGPASTYVASLGLMMFGGLGAFAATAALIAPAYLVLPLAHGYGRIRNSPRAQSFMAGLIAAQVGLIFCSLVHLGQGRLVSVPALLIFAITFALTTLFKQRAPVALTAAVGVGALFRIFA